MMKYLYCHTCKKPTDHTVTETKKGKQIYYTYTCTVCGTV